VSVKFEDFSPQIKAKVRENAARETKAAARRIVRRAQGKVRKRTGSLELGLYYSAGDGESTYAQAASAARGRNKRARIIPEVRPDHRQACTVAGAVEHWITNEFGARTTPPNPAVTQAVAEEGDQFESSLAAALLPE
jgi:hypothetical protein